MAIARTTDFPDKDLKLADFNKAISHPARIAILRVLAEKRECICGDLVLDLPLAQSTVSQHLKALKELGLIKGEVDGLRSRYCINWKEFSKYHALIEKFTGELLSFKQENNC